MKRLIDCCTSDLQGRTKKELLTAMEASEGRITISEISLFQQRMQLEPISDPEIASAFGADMLLLNAFDVYDPKIRGIEVGDAEEVVRTLKRYTGRLIGLNLEPVDDEAILGKKEEVPKGRQASVETAKRADELGFDFIVLIGNPGTGVTNNKIVEAVKELHEVVGDTMILMAGKMHAAGSRKDAATRIISKELIGELVTSGADVVLLPAPGTVPGIQLDFVTEMVQEIHRFGALSLTAIGTSQEGADQATIQEIALLCKMSGTDLHHIGDAGVGGICGENIMHYNITIKGKRHTYLRMARSVNR